MNEPRTIPILTHAAKTDPSRIAIVDASGDHTYGELLEQSHRAASALLAGRPDLAGARVAFLVPSSFDYPSVQWGIWRAGGVAVPLCTLHPPAEWSYVIEDSGAEIVVAHGEFAEKLEPVAKRLGRTFLRSEEIIRHAPGPLPEVEADRAAMLIYTSGTTSKPKGVVTTHEILSWQIRSLIEAWGWTPEDRTLLVLPLHHLHGVLNVLSCALWAGATCEMAPRFDADETWATILSGRLTVFMAVPTVYARLVKAWEAATPEKQAALTETCRKLRLMVCGSAALPVPTLERWKEISGHTLLERYGMTELGMALSNPLNGQRLPGFVGSPLPYVEVRLVDEFHQPVADGVPGQIQVKGPTVFREYWRRPEETEKAFVDGWFKTGDVAVRENGAFRILGRESVDIIKTGGYKVSALEIEDELRHHKAVDQCAVVGVPDPEWGERVAAAVVVKPGTSLDLDSLRAWSKERLAVYKVPSRLLILPELPRNAMGKVVKPELAQQFRS
jgi:malonyl-CoA/methylmalonyl-CoA synthetase